MKNFYDLFVHELKDMYSAEVQIERALTQYIKMATHSKLKNAFRMHHKETKNHISRLKQIARELKISLTKSKCEAMAGILLEGRKSIKEHYSREVRDALLIGSAQRIEHYEMSVYGTLKAYARHLKLTDVERILNITSKEEGHADKKLTEIANGTFLSTGINEKALRRKAA